MIGAVKLSSETVECERTPNLGPNHEEQRDLMERERKQVLAKK